MIRHQSPRNVQGFELNGGTRRSTGWGGFAAWGLVGALFSFSVLGAASIGLFVLPTALVALAVVGMRVRVWPEVAGALEGAAVLSLFVGGANFNSTPCPSSGSGVVDVGGPTSGTFSCGGFDPLPWLLVGLALAGAGLVAYSLARPRS